MSRRDRRGLGLALGAALFVLAVLAWRKGGWR